MTNDYGLLTSLMDRHGSDKGNRGHGFTHHYEAFLRPMRARATSVLEVGIAYAASLKGWRDYFPNGSVYGIDIASYDLSERRISTAVANQSDRVALTAAAKAFGSSFDLVVDDGGHAMDEQQATLAVLLPMVRVGGIYILEDLHTSLCRCGLNACAYRINAERSNTTLALVEHLQGGPLPAGHHLTGDELDHVCSIAGDVLIFDGPRAGSITSVIRRE